MSCLVPIADRMQPVPIYDQFWRITNFFYDENNILHLVRDFNPIRAYWTNGELIGAPFHYFRQIRYFPRNGIIPNIILALEGAIVDCGPDIHKMLCNYRASCKFWMTLQVQSESLNPWDGHYKECDQFLSAPVTRLFKIDGDVNGWVNP